MIILNGKYTTAKVMIDNVEPECISQIMSFINHPVFKNPVAIMPDTHAGKGSVIGFTMPMTSDMVIPNVIGVDIGCSVKTVNIGCILPSSLDNLDNAIRKQVPFGFDTHSKPLINLERQYDWKSLEHVIHMKMYSFATKNNIKYNAIPIDYKWFEKRLDVIGANRTRISNSVGTVGGGNHFCEVGVDENSNFWITVHTGSRNLGKCVCDYWQNKAINLIKQDKQELINAKVKEIREKCKGSDIQSSIKQARENLCMDNIPNKDLCYLEGENSIHYLEDMMVAQEYAKLNRDYIIKQIIKILNVNIVDEITSVHNYIDFDDYVIRKGAIRSYNSERMIIPFNMRDGILVCEGRSNKEWNCSAPHGAGRVMSRKKAKETIKIQDFKEQMKGIFSTSVTMNTLDEAPDAYKDAKIIEEAIEPTAKILFKIKPILNLKDSTGKSND